MSSFAGDVLRLIRHFWQTCIDQLKCAYETNLDVHTWTSAVSLK